MEWYCFTVVHCSLSQGLQLEEGVVSVKGWWWFGAPGGGLRGRSKGVVVVHWLQVDEGVRPGVVVVKGLEVFVLHVPITSTCSSTVSRRKATTSSS